MNAPAAWEPPTRLLLAWQITAAWQFDPALVTEVEIRFDARERGITEVNLEHRQLERFGASAASMRATVDSASGWGGLLERFASALQADDRSAMSTG